VHRSRSSRAKLLCVVFDQALGFVERAIDRDVQIRIENRAVVLSRDELGARKCEIDAHSIVSSVEPDASILRFDGDSTAREPIEQSVELSSATTYVLCDERRRSDIAKRDLQRKLHGVS
jgi:hypothetical protein